jgi:hypothetical protein
MLDFLIRIKALDRLGLAKPFKYVLLLLFTGCVVAALIYTYVVIDAVKERSHSPHVNIPSSR